MDNPTVQPPPVAVANPDDPDRLYLYRPGELLVASQSESLVTEHLDRVGAEVAEVSTDLDVIRFELPNVNVPELLDEILAEDETLRVGPNHVLWISEEEEETAEEPAQIRVRGYGLAGRTIATRPPTVPVRETLLARVRVALLDTEVGYHSAFAALGLSSPFADPDSLIDEAAHHATFVVGALLLQSPGVDLRAILAVDRRGLTDEFALASTMMHAMHDVDLICVPVGGLSYRNRPPVALSAVSSSDDMVIIAAAGNHGSARPFWPAAAPGVVAVAAIAADGRVARWSGRGDWVDRQAPGLGIVTTGLADSWVRTSGTSIAAASFTGSVARTMAEQGLGPRQALASTPASPAATEARSLAPPMQESAKPEARPASADPASSGGAGDRAARSAESPPLAAVPSRRRTPAPTDDEHSDAEPAVPASSAGVAAGYAADSFDRTTLVSGKTDLLSIRRDVDVLASIIASRRIHPPLSLGIFGDWGAGKSFLISQLKLRIDQLAKAVQRAPRVEREDSYYYGEIVQIEFNAWQYADGEIWASLINRVFEGIRDYLGGDERYRAVLTGIEQQDEEVAAAAQRLAEAKHAMDETTVPRPDRRIAEVAENNPEVAAAAKTFSDRLQLNAEKVDLIDVADRTRELYTLGGRLRQGWATQGRGGRALLLVTMVIGLVLGVAATILPSVAGALTAVAAVLTPAITLVAKVVKPTGDALRAGVRILGAGEREKQQYSEAKASYERAEAELAELRRQGPGGLYGFVQDRYRADDYRKYLGMVPLIREDLRRLTDLAARSEDGPGIERIVLYIDDLDRCGSRQVVRVLEAVNLLFGFPLFVVIVAVDSRWLVRSLEDEFPSFGPHDNAAPTAQDYLEKIIQIPFWLRPMSEQGFGRLITGLIRPEPRREASKLPADSAPRTVSPPAHKTPTAKRSPGAGPLTVVAAELDGTDATDLTDQSHQDAGTGTATPTEDHAAEPAINLTPETLTITAEELRFLRRLAPLVGTPRAAKRLVNTYQLVRVSVEDVPDFLATKQYEPLLMLLALVTRSPGLTAPMIRSLLGSPAADLSSFLRDLDPVTDDEGTEGWRRLAAELAEIAADCVTAQDVRQWMPAVSRFSFRPGLLAAASYSPSAPTSQPAPGEARTLPGGRPDAEPSPTS